GRVTPGGAGGRERCGSDSERAAAEAGETYRGRADPSPLRDGGPVLLGEPGVEQPLCRCGPRDRDAPSTPARTRAAPLLLPCLPRLPQAGIERARPGAGRSCRGDVPRLRQPDALRNQTV